MKLKNLLGIILSAFIILSVLSGIATVDEDESNATSQDVISVFKEEIETEEIDFEATTEIVSAITEEATTETTTKATTEATTEVTTKATTKITSATTKAEPSVWIPQSGSKYHSRSSCSNMKNPTEVTLSRAKNLGYTACSKCN